MTTLDVRITPSLHPGTVRAIEGFNDHADFLAPVENAFSEAYEGVRAVLVAREKADRNPGWTDANRVIQVAGLADKQTAKITRTFDVAHKRLSETIAAYEKQLSKPLDASSGSSLAGEIRAYARTLPTGKRHELVEAAIAKGDSTTASALLGGPAYLSGITDAMRETYTTRWNSAVAPEVAARLKAMEAARQLVEQNAGKVFGQMADAVGATPDTVKALREAQSAAEQAVIMKDAA